MSIGTSYRTNFDTLNEAVKNGDTCLVEVYDRLTGAPAVMLCAAFTDENDEVTFVPLARMLDGNPYDTYVMEQEDVAKYQGDGLRAVSRIADDAALRLTPLMENSRALAEAILEDHLEHNDIQDLVPQFIEEVVSQLPNGSWSLSKKELDSWLEHARGEDAKEEGETAP